LECAGKWSFQKKLRKKYNIESRSTLEIDETEEGLLLKPFNPIAEMKGLGKGVFGDAIEYQRKLRNDTKRSGATA
jgi:bifunctional DNA-binding transcriptional regulator/antitoxin component of YhaV-PrlF toxin-antitoxin module